jgi:hypothetical protein
MENGHPMKGCPFFRGWMACCHGLVSYFQTDRARPSSPCLCKRQTMYLSAHFIENTPNSDHEMITIHSIPPKKLAPTGFSIHFVYAILAKTPILPK